MSTPTANPERIGIVLAGGRSSRMGRDKALLDWQGRPLIEHMLQLLRDAGVARVVVSGARPEYDGIGDCEEGGGPLVGLHSACASLPDGEVLVLAVDMPRLPVALLQRLLAAEAAPCVVYEDFRLPMRLRLDAAARALLQELAQRPPRERSLAHLQQRLQVVALSASEAERAGLGNVNTPEEWQQAVRA
jgi:molybdopterin-guanine dinucleotide biosynthesis protein A